VLGKFAKGLTACGLLVGLLAAGTTTATAKGGEIGGSGELYLFSDDFGTVASHQAIYGRAYDRVLVGDWDGDGVDTLAVRRGSEYHFKNDLGGGPADRVVVYGRAADTVLVGDWDGDGVDTLAVRRGSEYHFKNDLGGGPADRVVVYGRAADTVLVGDWDGDGVDTLAVRRGSEYHFKNDLGGGPADRVVVYGRAADTVLVGDWNGDGMTSLGLRRPPAATGSSPQPPLFAYGTLRSGQSGHGVVGRTVKEATGRAPGLDLYMISGYSFPWAVPNSANTSGIAGELFWFSSSTYGSDIARLDRYERYDPSKPASGQLYTRERRATSHPGVSAWVYVATPRWASIARDSGTRIPSGDYLRW